MPLYPLSITPLTTVLQNSGRKNVAYRLRGLTWWMPSDCGRASTTCCAVTCRAFYLVGFCRIYCIVIRIDLTSCTENEAIDIPEIMPETIKQTDANKDDSGGAKKGEQNHML